MLHILFVCTGNTCRSPMCEAYFRDLCERAGCGWLTIGSAGISGIGGQPASEHCVRVMERLGIAMDRFRNTQLTAELLDQVDLVVAMTEAHRRRIGQMNPAAAAKTRLLLEYAGVGDDVADPFGGDLGEYLQCFNTMKKALDNLFLDLIHAHNKE